MGDGKAKNVLQYLDNLVEKGKASAGAIGPLKIAFTKVVQTIDGQAWTETDVRSIDIEDYMLRFANLTMGKYSSESLAAYKARSSKAIAWYLQFLDKPGWTPNVQRRKPAGRVQTVHPASAPTAEPSLKVAETAAGLPGEAAAAEAGGSSNRILYPYPLSDGQLIHISLPLKLYKQDAKRIGAFIESIAVDD